MATKKKTAKKAAPVKKAATKSAVKSVKAPAAKPATKKAKPAAAVDPEIQMIQAEVKDSVGQPISLAEIASAKEKIAGGSKEELYTLLKEWGYTVTL
jgi:hypothetical protein